MFLLMFADAVFMGYRMFIFAKKMSNRVKFWDCFRANLAGTCVAAITPTQGGWVGQLYILYRAGLPLAGGTTVVVITFLSTLLFLLFSTPFVILFKPQLYVGKMALLVQYSFIVFVFTLAGFFLLIRKSDFLLNLFSKLSLSRFIKSKHRLYKLLNTGSAKLERFANDYKGYTELFIKREKGTILLSVFITYIVHFIRFVTAYVIVRALETQVAFWNVIFIQVLLVFVSYFSPTPGASGVSEFAATFFMNPIVRPGAALCFTTLWRFSTTYFELFVGGIIIMVQLRRDIRQNTKYELEELKTED
jgi:uncharacterized protein (TIRG00374 family)